MKKLSSTVRSLIASSLGLPGMQELLAQEPPDEGISYLFNYYDEEPLPADKLAFGSPERYTIYSQQLRWVKNLDESYSLTVELLHEGMSGSSPWYVMPDPVAGPLQVMSGATIRENRNQADVALSRRGNGFTHTAALGYSTEDDYRAVYGRYSGEKESADGLSTIAWGLSYSDDDLEPTDAALFGRVESATRDSFSVSTSFTQVLNRNALLQTGVTLTSQSGYLSDPYKLVWVGETVLSDSRPDRRVMWTWTTRFRQYMERSKAALHIDYRYLTDDWSVRTSTLDLAWHQPAGENWEITPALRYYTQTAADFYGPIFSTTPGDGYWSSDFRLATYGALSYRLDGVMRKEKWSLSLAAEYYNSARHLALSGTPQDTPALVDFWRFTASCTVNL
ncbi:MAG TPA: DUF3570 domain-containing protein [Xanthomonadales bacterium]|nr:DUF3570 domain-containing protein [Xanthomonadales bacterium]